MGGRRLAPAAAVVAALMFVSLPAAGASATVSSHSPRGAATGMRPMSHPTPVPATGSGRTARHWTGSMRALGRTSPAPAETAAPITPVHPAAPGTVTPRAAAPQAVRVTAPTVTANFTGNDEGLGGQLAGDPNAATNGTQILESTGVYLRVYGNNGGITCPGVLLAHFLRAPDGDGPAEARLQYDDANHRFSLIADVASTSGPTALYVSVSQTSDPCGSWNTYRLTFTGDQFPAGVTIDYPTLGQDSRALLIGTSEAQGGFLTGDFSAFAVSKSDLYANKTVSFPVFALDRDNMVTAVANTGNPLVDSPNSYFLATGPGSVAGGYALYRMTGSGSANPSLTQQAVITVPYFGPNRAPQPGTSNTLDALDGRIQAPPVFDGKRIWFTHTIDTTNAHPNGSTTTVRYGYIDTGNNSAQVAEARHSSTSADLNPSIGVGLDPNGIETIFLNWVYTDTAHNVPASDTVATLIYDGGTLPTLQGADQTLVTGSITTLNKRFGEFSTVAVDPAVTDGTCAVTAQTYFLPNDGAWSSQVARVCGPATAAVPNVINSTVSAARTALQAVSLRGDNLTTTGCDPSLSGLVASTSPSPGTLAPVGSQIVLTVCTVTQATVPNVIGDTAAAATSALQSAGLVVGTIGSTTSCDVAKGAVADTSPRPGDVVAIGSAVNLRTSVGRPKTPCQ
jgi:hypothetical protein